MFWEITSEDNSEFVTDIKEKLFGVISLGSQKANKEKWFVVKLHIQFEIKQVQIFWKFIQSFAL